MEARPYGVWGRWGARNTTLPVDRRRGGCGGRLRTKPASPVIRRRRTGDGAPYDVWGKFPHRNYVVRHPEEGASGTPPPTVVARCRFQQSREVQFITPVTLYAATFDTHQLVGCTVLGAPWSCDRRGNVGADGRRGRLHPRFPRRVRLRPPPNVCNPAGTARAPLVRREGTLSVVQHAATFVSQPPVRGGVLDAPCSDYCRGWIGASVWLDRQHPRLPRCARLASAAPRMQFRGHSPRTIFYGRTYAIRQPTPGGRGSPPLRCSGKGLCLSPKSPATPQSRRKAPRQLPFQGSRESGVRAFRRCPSSHAGRAWKPAPTV